MPMTHLIVTWCVCKQCVPCVALGLMLFVIMVKEFTPFVVVQAF